MSKKEEGKYRPNLIYTSLLKEISKTREYGIKKYGGIGEDWVTTEAIRHLNATIRHVRAFMDGEEFDSKSGIHHLSHAASNIMFEIERIERAKQIIFLTNGEDIGRASEGFQVGLKTDDKDIVNPDEANIKMVNKKTSDEMLNLGEYLIRPKDKEI